MKKLLTLVLTVTLVMSMGKMAFAADTPETIDKAGSKEIDVTAKYSSSTNTPTIYSVDIEWSNMAFTYTQKETKNWNAADHSYNIVSEGSWDRTTATIKVTNHSNISVNVDVQYAEEENTGVNATIANASAALDAGEEGNYLGADSLTAVLTIGGTPNETITSEGVKVGTVKVAIS